VGILYEVQTSLSRQELIDFFNNRKIFTDGEICKLLFYDNKTYLTLEQENAEGYIYEMFTHLFNFTIK